MVMVVAGALPQHAPQPPVIAADRADGAVIGPAETPVSGPSLEAAQSASVSPISVTKIITSEPLLLLLMGALLIALAGSIRRLTKSRAKPHAGLPRRT